MHLDAVGESVKLDQFSLLFHHEILRADELKPGCLADADRLICHLEEPAT